MCLHGDKEVPDEGKKVIIVSCIKVKLVKMSVMIIKG